VAPPQAQAGAQSVHPTGPSNDNNPTQSQWFQLTASATSGNVSATATVYGSNDGQNWTNLGATLSTALTVTGVASGSAAAQTAIPCKHYAAVLSTLTGTGAVATLTMSA